MVKGGKGNQFGEGEDLKRGLCPLLQDYPLTLKKH
jgi:hypothetical protein